MFGLARDGKTNDRGMPNLLQAALFAKEFEDVLYFTDPLRAAQKVLFYPEYLERGPPERIEVEPEGAL